MKRVLPILFLTFAGCHRKDMPLLSVVSPASASGRIILAMGQSNMAPRPDRYATVSSSFQEDNQNLIVINCAVGGTPISSWQASSPNFQNCLAQARAYPFPVVGILFYQGETDAWDKRTDWDQGFLSAVQGWRGVLGNVPIVYAQIATTDNSEGWDTSTWELVKSQQAMIHIQNAVMVKTDDQPLMDAVHLTTEAVQVIGKRMSLAFNSLVEGNS